MGDPSLLDSGEFLTGECRDYLTGDDNSGGVDAKLSVKRLPDDPEDPRSSQPRVKTRERILPIEPALARKVQDYMLKERRQTPDAKRSPFLILARSGSPLSIKGLNKIFEQIINRYSDFTGLLTPHVGLLAYRELDDVLGLSDLAGELLADGRTGKNGRHALLGMLRQSVFGRLAGYEDVNDADRLRHDPAMRWVVGGKAAKGRAASPSQMGRFETQWLAASANHSALAHLSGNWIDRARRG